MNPSLLGAITFDPTIRGILVVIVGAVVLIGSIFMIVSTNSGVRQGFLIVGAALFGWGFLMGMVWWIYGIGLIGRPPAWSAKEINYSRESALWTADQFSKPPPDPADMPDPVETLNRYPLVRAMALATEGPAYEPKTLGSVVGLANSLIVAKPEDAARAQASLRDPKYTEFLSENPTVSETFNQTPAATLEAVQAQARELRSAIEDPIAPWCLLGDADSRRGEAVAAADAALATNKVFGETTGPSNYIVGDVYFTGSKDGCQPLTERSTVGQAWHRVSNTVRLKNPPTWSVVTVTKAAVQVVPDGQAPPPPAKAEGAGPVSVVMERNLGNKRWPPFVFTVANLVLFLSFAWMLHHRDRQAQANIAAAAAALEKSR